jgi:hypothetical protein
MSGQDAACGRHHERRGYALVGHVADDEPDATVGKRDHVVEVAPDLARRPVVGSDVPAGQVGQLLGEEVLLDQSRDFQLLLEALPCRRLCFLFAHELTDAQRRRSLRGQIVKQLPIVGRVILFREARSEVEDTDELALADQRDSQLHPRGPELAHRRGVQIEVVEIDYTA